MKAIFALCALALLALGTIPAEAASKTNRFCWFKTNYDQMNCDSSSIGEIAPNPTFVQEPEPEPQPECEPKEAYKTDKGWNGRGKSVDRQANNN